MSSCVEDTNTVDLEINEAGQLTADVKVSPNSGNILQEVANGLFVDSATSTVPVGAVIPYAAAAAPTGWLLCDGSAVSRSTYPNLFSLLGVTYGPGDGSSTFNVPDIRGRVPVGFAAAGGNIQVSTLNNNDGVALANRRPQHRHTPHAHVGGKDTSGAPNTGKALMWGQGDDQLGPSNDGGSGVGTDALDAPAWLVLNYIIKAS